jgi:catechol 2,3-dioxygenase-like lactoylglutathione lyase family enzyme
LEDAEGDLMTARFGVDARAVGRYAFFDGGSIAIELLEWTAPHRNGDAPINSDQGGRHLALRVDNMAAALERLAASPGVAIRQPNDAGFIYVRTPFGLEIQLLPSS